MAEQYVDLQTLKFLLYQVHDLKKVLEAEYYAEHDVESIDLLLNSIKDFSDKELYPYFKEMDEQAAYFKDGKIIVHPQLKTILEKGGEMGLIAAPFDFEEGGMQLPMMAGTAAMYIQEAANNHLPGYLSLTFGSAELIVHFGSQELKDLYVPKMLSGEWCGTMCLTEPQAGSSLSDITTSATPAEDGSYKIKGQKIFISGGDHQYADNFVHLLLGRIEGAPAGTKGISLFVVPKNRIKADGSLEFNDVNTAGDFQKLGQKGYCTTHLMFGEGDDCQGWLIGEPNKGLKYMFLMMNGARIAVGRGASAIAMAAYQASLQYANERPQGRPINNSGNKDLDKEQSLIIKHPDVRRMLLLQKVVAEGSLSLILLASKYNDLSKHASTEEERNRYQLLLEILTPITKTYPSEMGLTSVSNGLQILGGYGFCTEFILQQYYRDIRIFSLYEGTTGIQSLDLLGRKVPMKGGQALQLLAAEVMKSIQAAQKHEDLKPYATKLGAKLELTQEVMGFLSGFAMEGDFNRYLSDATVFMDFFSKIVLAWLWLDMATEAKIALAAEDKPYTNGFYESKIHAMRFYFKYELTQTVGLAQTLMDKDVLTLANQDNVFV